MDKFVITACTDSWHLANGVHCPSVICFYPRTFESAEAALESMEAQLKEKFRIVSIPKPKYFNPFRFAIQCDGIEGVGQIIKVEF